MRVTKLIDHCIIIDAGSFQQLHISEAIPVLPEFIESNSFIHLDGGVLGRTDEMLVIRGVNVFPSSLDEIIRSFDDIDEYRMTASRHGELDRLSIEIEDSQNNPQRVEQLIEVRLGLHVDVRCVASQSLPRFEA